MKYLYAILLIVLLAPTVASAALPFTTDCEGIQGYPSSYRLCRLLIDIRDIIGIFGFAVSVVVIIIGGVIYITAGDSEDKTKKGRKFIINGLIGLAIVIAAEFLVGLVADFLEGRLMP